MSNRDLKRFTRRRGLKKTKTFKISAELNAKLETAFARYLLVFGEELIFSRCGEDSVKELIDEINKQCDDHEGGEEVSA